MRIIHERQLNHFAIAIIFFVLFSLCPPLTPEASGSSVTLAWDPNQESTLAGYKVFNGPASRNYNGTVDVGNSTSCIVSGLLPGSTYYFAAKAYDTAGNESDYSNEVVYTVPAACSISLSPTSQSVAASGGSGGITVTAPSGCSWSVTSSAAWITITSAGSGSGNGVVNYSIASNSGNSARAGNINIGSQTFAVSQSANVATYTITASAGSNGSISPIGSVLVNAGASKTFTITPRSGYKVYRVLINGVSIGAVTKYTFANVTANQTIRAEFTSTWSWHR